MKKVLVFLLLVGLAATAHAQSMLSHLSKPQKKMSVNIADSTLPTPSKDSVFSGPRFSGASLLYGLSNGYTASNVYAVTGLDWTHATFNASTQRWYINWSAGIIAGAGGHIAPNNLQEVTVAGAHINLFNGFLVLGVLYTFNKPSNVRSPWVAAIGGNAYFVPTN